MNNVAKDFNYIYAILQLQLKYKEKLKIKICNLILSIPFSTSIFTFLCILIRFSYNKVKVFDKFLF